MARYNTTSHKSKPPVATTTSPITTVSEQPDTRTALGAPAWTRTAQSELFLLASGALLNGKNDFHELSEDRDNRFSQLVRKTTADNPAWTADMLKWLRSEGNMRTAAVVGAAEHVAECIRLGIPGSRQVVDSVLQRPDEPGELLAYWTAMYGRRIPKPIKRGIADAVRRMYNGKSLLKYDTASHAYRFGDVLNLVHAAPRRIGEGTFKPVVLGEVKDCPAPENKRFRKRRDANRAAQLYNKNNSDAPALRAYACQCGWFHTTVKPLGTQKLGEVPRPVVEYHWVGAEENMWQGDVFRYALDRRHHPDTAVPPASNRTLTAHTALMELPVAERRPAVTSPGGTELLAAAGMTWEALAGWLQGPMDKAVWEAIIPSMGTMAQLRNLRNFDQAGVSDDIAASIAAQLADPNVIAASKQFPFRYLAAYRATQEAGSLRWAYPLEKALNHSLANVPSLGGRSLVLVDRSPSMFPESGFYTPDAADKRLGLARADQAAIFGCALALRGENVTLVEFGGDSKVVRVPRGSSLLPLLGMFSQISYTDIAAAIQKHYKKHDRIVIITDEQTRPGYVPSVGPNAYRLGLQRETPLKDLVPTNIPVFMWNLGGYTPSAAPTGSDCWFTLGGLTDQAFKLIPMLESGTAGVWPWDAVSQGA